ncbi:class I SAM-dependent methyltransferase [candidate division KSB1 bacterium]|nr:class I SAM-dependent methyltransferase [candidate division KSB1 bacterium]
MKSRIERTAKLIDKTGIILDIGCGTGDIYDNIKTYSKHFTYIGMDKESARLVQSDKSISRISGDVYHIPLANSSVESVLLLQVFEHLDRPVDAIREINRVLKPTGTLILSTNNALYWGELFTEVVCYVKTLINRLVNGTNKVRRPIIFGSELFRRHVFVVTPSSLHTLLHINGFEYNHTIFCDGFPRWNYFIFATFLPFLMNIQIIKATKMNPSPDYII